jgi:flagellar export protein FliJ
VPSFQFRLAPVLRLRERVKEEKQFELRALHIERTQLEEEIGNLLARSESIGLAFAPTDGAVVTAAELQLIDDYAQLLDRQIARKRADLSSLRERMIKKQQEFTEAAREVKSLEVLRQRLAEKYRRAQNLEEQKFLDEIGQRKSVRH